MDNSADSIEAYCFDSSKTSSSLLAANYDSSKFEAAISVFLTANSANYIFYLVSSTCTCSAV